MTGRARMWSKLSTSAFLRSASILSSAQGIAYAIGLLSIPILARVYSPSDVGQVALITSLASVVAGATSFGLQSAVVKVRHSYQAHVIMSVGISLSFVAISLGLMIALYLTQSGVQALPMGGTLPAWFALSSVAALAILTNVSSYLSYYANRMAANRVLFLNTLISASSTLMVGIPLGLLGAGPSGLLCAALVAALLAILQMAWRLRPRLPRPGLRDLRFVFSRYRDFVLFLYPANFLETLTAQLPRQALALGFGNSSLGQLSMTDRILSVPLRLFGAPLSTVYFREASSRSNSGEDVGFFTYRIVTRILYLAALPLAALSVWGRELFSFFLGADWSIAGSIAAILAVPGAFELGRICVSTALVVGNRQRVNLLLGFVRLVTEGGALLLGLALHLDLFTFLQLFAAASVIFYIFDMTLTLRILKAPHWSYLRRALGFVVVVVTAIVAKGLLTA